MKATLDLVYEWHYTRLLDLAEALKMEGWTVELVLSEGELPFMEVKRRRKP